MPLSLLGANIETIESYVGENKKISLVVWWPNQFDSKTFNMIVESKKKTSITNEVMMYRIEGSSHDNEYILQLSLKITNGFVTEYKLFTIPQDDTHVRNQYKSEAGYGIEIHVPSLVRGNRNKRFFGGRSRRYNRRKHRLARKSHRRRR